MVYRNIKICFQKLTRTSRNYYFENLAVQTFVDFTHNSSYSSKCQQMLQPYSNFCSFSFCLTVLTFTRKLVHTCSMYVMYCKIVDILNTFGFAKLLEHDFLS